MNQKPLTYLRDGVIENKWSSRRLKNNIKSMIHISSVGLYLTHECNLKCKHCFWGTSEPIDDELNLSQWQSIIDQFIANGTYHYHICGREPFMSNKLLDILNYLSFKKKTNKLKYGIITNGILLKKYCHELKNLDIDYLIFSLDGLRQGNDFIRGKDNFEKTWEALELALKYKLAKSISTSTIIYSGNIDEIPNMVLELNRLGIKHIYLQPIMNYKMGNIENLLILPEKMNDLLLILNDTIQNIDGAKIEVEIPPTYLPYMYKWNSDVKRGFDLYISNRDPIVEVGGSKFAFDYHIFCQAFWKRARITSDGYFLGCDVHITTKDYKDYSLGNLKYESLENLIRSIDKNWMFENTINSYQNMECKKCKNFRFCLGGCRSMSFIKCNDWDKKDPMCTF